MVGVMFIIEGHTVVVNYGRSYVHYCRPYCGGELWQATTVWPSIMNITHTIIHNHSIAFNNEHNSCPNSQPQYGLQ
jgi:hypothetical protein